MRDARVDVTTLLEVYVFEEIATRQGGWDGIPMHVDSIELRNCALNRHQPLPEVFVNTKFQLRRCHSNNPLVRLSNGPSCALGDPRPGRTPAPCHACSVNT